MCLQGHRSTVTVNQNLIFEICVLQKLIEIVRDVLLKLNTDSVDVRQETITWTPFT